MGERSTLSLFGYLSLLLISYPSAMHHAPLHHTLLDAQRLREIIRETRSGFAPDHVARTLRQGGYEIAEDQPGDVADILRELVVMAGERLRDAGIEPQHREIEGSERLTKRERDFVASETLLLFYLAIAEKQARKVDRALEAAHEGLAWCRAIGDRAGMAMLWRAIASIRASTGDYDGEEAGLRQSVECARDSRDAAALIASLDALSAWFVVRMRLDEAEAAVEEALSLARQESVAHTSDYPSLLLHRARVQLYRTHYADGIRTLREALRWSDADNDPRGRAALLTHLGSVYLRLEQYQQCIECQHEVVQLGEILGSREVQGWGYFRLAEAHMKLNEKEKTEEMLDRATACAAQDYHQLRLMSAAKRAQVRAGQERYNEGMEICRAVIAETEGTNNLPDLTMFAYRTMGEIEGQRDRHEPSMEYYRRAVKIAETHFAARAPGLRVAVAEALHRLGRHNDMEQELRLIEASKALNDTERFRLLHLRSALAEEHGDIQAALDFEREAFAVERELLRRSAADSLRNTRIVAETSLLEREADFERERRQRVERELAEAVVELGDRRRLAEEMEERIRGLISRVGTDQERATGRALREVLHELRAQSGPSESPLRYLSGVDQDFYARLRQHWPDLTAKQERLCGLIRAGLGSKEIATLLDLGQEGLKAQRKRLRKRMNLDPEVKLETMLAEI